MTDEQKKILDALKFKETILSMSFWENQKYYKEIAQSLGGSNSRVKEIHNCCEEIRIDWHECSGQIKEFLTAIGEKAE